MDSERKEEIAMMLMRKFWLPGHIHIFQHHLERELEKQVDIDELRQDIEQFRGEEKSRWTKSQWGQIAMIWLTWMYIPEDQYKAGITLYRHSRRSVGNIAAKIGITTAEAMELFREVLIDQVRETYRDPASDEE